MGEIEVRQATLRDLPAATSVLMDAFSAHPLRQHVLPGARRRRIAIASGDTALFAEAVLCGTGYVAIVDGQIVGVLSWLEPEEHPRPRWRAVALDLARAPFLLCPPHGFRALGFQKAIDKFHRNEPSLYFTIAATYRHMQRRGIASALIRRMLARADEMKCSVFLETSNQKNLALYGRLGFEIVDSASPIRGGPEVFAMLRQGL